MPEWLHNRLYSRLRITIFYGISQANLSVRRLLWEGVREFVQKLHVRGWCDIRFANRGGMQNTQLS
jgi:hypothetical protein